MDSQSHLLFGQVILEKLDLPREYVDWAVSPDIDMKCLHRYLNHRFSSVSSTFSKFSTARPDLPTNNKIAIATMITSHFYLDMFSGPIWCWGIYAPAIDTPPSILSEYLKDKNYYLEKNPDIADQLWKDSLKLFETHLNPSTIEQLISSFVCELGNYTPFLFPRFNYAYKHLEDFVGHSISRIACGNVTAVYFSFLQRFFDKF